MFDNRSQTPTATAAVPSYDSDTRVVAIPLPSSLDVSRKLIFKTDLLLMFGPAGFSEGSYDKTEYFYFGGRTEFDVRAILDFAVGQLRDMA